MASANAAASVLTLSLPSAKRVLPHGVTIVGVKRHGEDFLQHPMTTSDQQPAGSNDHQ